MNDYKKLIIENLNNPDELENLYQEDPESFTSAFPEIYTENPDSLVLQAWFHRLNYMQESEPKPTEERIAISIPKPRLINWELYMALILIIINGTFGRLSHLIPSIATNIVTNNFPLILIFSIIVMFTFKIQISRKNILITVLIFVLSAIFVNIFLQNVDKSQTEALSYIHLPIMLWAWAGFVYMGFKIKDTKRVMDFFSFNGQLLIYMAIFFICMGILFSLTKVLFNTIGIKVSNVFEDFFSYFFFSGPLLSIYLLQRSKKKLGNLIPSMAKIFSILVLFVLVLLTLTIMITDASPYFDRSFLVAFNFLLVSVMALIIFSITQQVDTDSKTFSDYVNIALIGITIILDLYALSAILYRTFTIELTPNRFTVIGMNLIILANLLAIAIQYWKYLKSKASINSVKDCITKFYPVYFIWAGFVAFLLPFIFGFK
jgi:hypothetical protein